MPHYTAFLADGSSLREDGLLAAGLGFPAVQEAEAAGQLVAFVVDLDDGLTKLGVDLATGAVWIGPDRYEVIRPDAPLRLIYYKRMTASAAGQVLEAEARSSFAPVMEFIAVGWQSTIVVGGEPRNVRFGIRAYPGGYAIADDALHVESSIPNRYVVGEEI